MAGELTARPSGVSRNDSIFESEDGSRRGSEFRVDTGATAVQRTLSNIGTIALFKGAVEERLDVMENQMKLFMKFRNAMLQGDYLSRLIKMLAGEGCYEIDEIVDRVFLIKAISNCHCFLFIFLDASTHLYKWVCPSVRPWVLWSVRNSFFQ